MATTNGRDRDATDASALGDVEEPPAAWVERAAAVLDDTETVLSRLWEDAVGNARGSASTDALARATRHVRQARRALREEPLG